MKMKWGWTNKDATLEDVKAKVGKGWSGILERLVRDLEQLGWDGEVVQVKEKFGGLRFYIGSGSSEIFNRIGEAEQESYQVCEWCGKPGTLDQSQFWVLTLCSDCTAKRTEDRKIAAERAQLIEEKRKKNQPILDRFKQAYRGQEGYKFACLSGDERNIIDVFHHGPPEAYPETFEGFRVAKHLSVSKR